MHHDDNNHRHPHNRDLRHRREQHPEGFERDRYFNDFQSRWGEPSPPLNLHQDTWQSHNMGQFQREGQLHRHNEEWLPNQRRPHQSRHHQDHHQQRDISWRQRDVNFDTDNQRAEDRWQQDETIPHPDDSRRRRRGIPDDNQYHEENQRRRDRR